MPETRSFYAPGINLDDLIRTVSNWLSIHDFETRKVDLPGGVTIQARQPESWKSFLGMSSALNITFTTRGNNLDVTAEAGKWGDKIAVGAVGLLIHPLLITTAYGVWKQSQLPEKIFTVIEQYVREKQGYARVPVTPATTSATTSSATTAPTRIPVTSTVGNAVENVGSAVENVISTAVNKITPQEKSCVKCGTPASPDAKFCQQCGTRFQPESVKID